MKKFVALLFIFGILYIVAVYKPSIRIPRDTHRGFYDTPISEMILIDGTPISEITSVEEEEHHSFDMDYLLTGEGTALDKCVYLHDSIRDSGGIGSFVSNTMSSDLQGRVNNMMDDAREKMDENIYSDLNH